MSHRRTESIESICTVLSCTSEEFLGLYDGKHAPDILHADSMSIIEKNRESLGAGDKGYRLDDLLIGMLDHAPDSLGQRYVAVAIHIARQKGGDTLVTIAKAWLEHLFLPMIAISREIKTEPSGSQTPTIDTTVQHIESTTRGRQATFRKELAKREQYYCAITHTFDAAHAINLMAQGLQQQIPGVGHRRMQAAHIIPFLDDTAVTTKAIRDAARTWDMLQSWTRLDIRALAGSNINTASNGIYMTNDEHVAFGRFRFYLEQDANPATPNRYHLHMSQTGLRTSTGDTTRVVEFPTFAQSGVEPPNPKYIRVHAAFAKVLNLCGAAEYMDSIERDAERIAALRVDDSNFAAVLTSKLEIAAH